MKSQVELKRGQQSVLEYRFHPLLQGITKALNKSDISPSFVFKHTFPPISFIFIVFAHLVYTKVSYICKCPFNSHDLFSYPLSQGTGSSTGSALCRWLEAHKP